MSHDRNNLGQVGLVVSGLGLVALIVLGWWRIDIVRYTTLCSLLGLVLSLAGLWRRPRRPAAWGVILGLLGTLYLPTVFLPLLIRG
jgi:hypothetical protein